jgi:integrase
MQPFIDKRSEEDEVSPTTVNRTLEIVRTILNRAARVWRDDEGRPWLASAPLIEMLDETPRKPYPLTLEEQRRLFAELPPHLVKMALFAVNTGLRDENVCGLRWDWEVKVPDLGCSVFVIPAEAFKSEREHVVVLNEVARSVVESCRGQHPTYVFTYQGTQQEAQADRVKTMNNTAWQKARARANLVGVRVHDLRHSFGQRLRQAKVAAEDRALLMGARHGRHDEPLRDGHDRATDRDDQCGAGHARHDDGVACDKDREKSRRKPERG